MKRIGRFALVASFLGVFSVAGCASEAPHGSTAAEEQQLRPAPPEPKPPPEPPAPIPKPGPTHTGDPGPEQAPKTLR